MQSYLRRSAASGRSAAHFGPFLATFSPHSTNPFLNYAIPDDDGRPSAADVAALTAAYRSRDLVPRLEFLGHTAPAVEAALLAAGYEVERRVPLMRCAVVRQPPNPVGIDLVVPASADDLAGLVDAQHEAFDVPSPSPEAIEKSWQQLRRGGFAVLARDRATGATVGGGAAEAITDGTTEVAGIAVRASHRRRGIGAAVTAFLTSATQAQGARTVFLTPAGIPEQRIYASVGFEPTEDMVHLSLPAARGAGMPGTTPS
jgi:ribosomal protein S18 acetylase RimI-like enzyme